jgi:membrane associated rhomboid family serine protease
MGIYDREYYRDDEGGWGSWGAGSATRWLVGVTVGLWVAQLFTRGAAWGGVNALLGFHPDLVAQGQVWRLVTPFFCNPERDLLGVIFGMLILYWVGTQLEERYGTREFLAFYLLSGFVSHLAYFALTLLGIAPVPPPQFLLVGSSVTVNAAFVLYAFINPRAIVLLFFVLPVPIWLLAAAYVTFSALGVMVGSPSSFIALGGALFGAGYYLTGIRLSSLVPGRGFSLRRARSQPRLRVVPPDELDDDTDDPAPPPPPEDRIEDRVDRVLEKVSRHGQESLTPEEREILFRAGEHYKKRRR